MSRHHIQLRHQGGVIVVVAGYDRPLRELFLQVLRCRDNEPTREEDILYDSLHDPELDWTVIGTLTNKLSALGIQVPEGLTDAVCKDQRINAGNSVVRHRIDQPPEVLLAG